MDPVAVYAEDTVRTALSKMARAFEACGHATSQMDARFLLQGILGVDGAALMRNPEIQIGTQAAAVTAAMLRRLKHEPVSRILGVREFYGRTFCVTPDVLDPRADTETLIDLVLDVLREQGRLKAPLRIADIGTGSGAIIITLLAELPTATGLAIDVSWAALEVAKANAEALGVLNRLEFLQTRGLQGVHGGVDIVVSNPPYIPSNVISHLEAEVRAFDPHLALDGGPDGLQIYQEIVSDISKLDKSAWVFLEVGASQAAAVEALFSAIGSTPRRRRSDLGGHVRVVALEHHR